MATSNMDEMVARARFEETELKELTKRDSTLHSRKMYPPKDCSGVQVDQT